MISIKYNTILWNETIVKIINEINVLNRYNDSKGINTIKIRVE